MIRRWPRKQPYLTDDMVEAWFKALDALPGPAVRGSNARNRDRGATKTERNAWADLVTQLEPKPEGEEQK